MKQEAWRLAARMAVVFLLLTMCVGGAGAQSFLTTHTMTLKQAEWSASVEFPTGGNKAVVEHVLRWIADVLDIEYKKNAPFASQMSWVHTYLRPGETLRTPRMCVMAFTGGAERGGLRPGEAVVFRDGLRHGGSVGGREERG